MNSISGNTGLSAFVFTETSENVRQELRMHRPSSSPPLPFGCPGQSGFRVPQGAHILLSSCDGGVKNWWHFLKRACRAQKPTLAFSQLRHTVLQRAFEKLSLSGFSPTPAPAGALTKRSRIEFGSNTL
jgi:hypothetical protein